LNGTSLSSGGSLTVASNAVLNLQAQVVFAGPVTNSGTVNWLADYVYLNNNGTTATGEFWNQAGALFDIQCNQSVSLYSSFGNFHNAGLVRKSAGTGTTTVSVLFTNTGTVEGQTGTLSFTGGYSSTSSANLAISLGGAVSGSGYGHIHFTSALPMGGTFTVRTRNGYLPNPGNTFQVLSYPPATNLFTCLSGLDLGGGILLQPQFDSTSLTLLATAYTTNASQPRLFMNRTLGGLAITWPVFSGWTLQSTTNLSSSAWISVSTACGNQAVVPISAPQQYFRLSQ
jgi:hypothetical protein